MHQPMANTNEALCLAFLKIILAEYLSARITGCGNQQGQHYNRPSSSIRQG